MSTNNPEEQGQYLIGPGRPPLHSRFTPGSSGNPGGRPKGTPSIPHLIARLLAMNAADWQTFEPENAAEIIALQAIKDAARSTFIDPAAVKSREFIVDRLHGKPIQRRADVTVDEVVSKARMAYELGLRIRDNIATHCQQIACDDACATRLQSLIPPDDASVLEAVLATVDEQYHEAVVRELGES